MKKKLLIINKTQFGYHTDTYYYCLYLRDEFEIQYICLDKGMNRNAIEGVKVIYIPSVCNYFTRALQFLVEIIKLINKEKFNIIFIDYFLGASILAIFTKKIKTVLDIRTGSIAISKWKRLRQNWVLRCERHFFKNVSVISESVGKTLNLHKTSNILPLGAVQISNKQKTFNKLKLLYVGTFNNRNIEITIEAVAKFVDEVSSNISYQIVGYGSEMEIALLQKFIIKYNLKGIVSYEGRIKIEDLIAYFDNNNIGVTFIPITNYFTHQPPTKLFEYALSGMVNIATKTEYNKKLITKVNGVLCSDNSNGFYSALCEIHRNLKNYNSTHIKNSLASYNWDQIVREKLIPILKSI